MNKVMKVAGLATALCAVMSANTLITKYCGNTEDYADGKVFIQKNDKKTDGIHDPALWISLTGLGIAGLAGANIRKNKFQKENLLGSIQQLIPESCNVVSGKTVKSRQEKEMILDSNYYELTGLLHKTQITDKAAFAQFKFTYGALKHAVQYGDIPESDLGIKLEYLALKSITPLKKAEKLKKQYENKYPAVDFNKIYGQIKYIKRGYYNFVSDELILYKGLKRDILLYRINEIEKYVLKEENSNVFYKHDRETLLQNISELRDKLKNNKEYDSQMLIKINDIYRSKRLQKIVEI